MLYGRALNVLSGFNQEALALLAKAVKLDPNLVEAWNHLGECYWKNNDVKAAHNCFTGALSHVSIHSKLQLVFDGKIHLILGRRKAPNS
jgi:Tfp pilus assembly protein PilF